MVHNENEYESTAEEATALVYQGHEHYDVVVKHTDVTWRLGLLHGHMAAG